jgi:hypothetical protein
MSAMNEIEPMFACGPSFGPGAIALIFCVIGAWWISGALAVVNPLMIGFLKTSARFKQVNFGCWALYVIPGILLLLGLYEVIPLNRAFNVPWFAYAVAIPFITISHFIFLLGTRRKVHREITSAGNSA